jgi:hypothetical protein
LRGDPKGLLFRAIGRGRLTHTAHLKNGSTVEEASAMANYVSMRTTQLSDRQRDEVRLDEVQRIAILRLPGMGQAKMRKDQFFAQHPFCCFCGGAKSATTEDHIPARAFFTNRQWPNGYVFPSCDTCNQDTKANEAVAAAISRCSPGPSNENEKEELRRLIEGIINNDRATFDEMTDFGAKLHFFQESTSLILPYHYISEAPLIQIGPLTHAHLDHFANKLIKALHYLHTKRIVPTDAKILKGIYTNLSVIQGHGPPGILRDLPGAPTLERNRQPLRDQFAYEYGLSADHLRSVFSVRFRGSFLVGGFVDARPSSAG